LVEEARGQLTPFEAAARLFAEVHAADPSGAAERYHEVLARWVDALAPDASVALRLASRCQHLGRYAIPRADYPEGLAGYKRWRAAAALAHARQASEILAAAGFDAATRGRVSDLLVKKGLKHDPEVQLLEDAICLAFLELELEGFAGKHDRVKVVAILRKTWAKMSPRGHAAAEGLVAGLSEPLRAFVAEALQR
jgi:hypothetical protein